MTEVWGRSPISASWGAYVPTELIEEGRGVEAFSKLKFPDGTTEMRKNNEIRWGSPKFKPINAVDHITDQTKLNGLIRSVELEPKFAKLTDEDKFRYQITWTHHTVLDENHGNDWVYEDELKLNTHGSRSYMDDELVYMVDKEKKTAVPVTIFSLQGYDEDKKDWIYTIVIDDVYSVIAGKLLYRTLQGVPERMTDKGEPSGFVSAHDAKLVDFWNMTTAEKRALYGDQWYLTVEGSPWLMMPDEDGNPVPDRAYMIQLGMMAPKATEMSPLAAFSRATPLPIPPICLTAFSVFIGLFSISKASISPQFTPVGLSAVFPANSGSTTRGAFVRTGLSRNSFCQPLPVGFGSSGTIFLFPIPRALFIFLSISALVATSKLFVSILSLISVYISSMVMSGFCSLHAAKGLISVAFGAIIPN